MDKNLATTENFDEKVKTSQSTQLVSIIERSDVILFHDEYDEPYARFRVGRHFELWKIRSKHFKRWLSHLYWEKYEKAPNNESLNASYNVIEATACFKGEKFNLHNRVAYHESSFWYDLGDGRAVRISAEGWEIVADPPILFRSYAHQKAQVEPQGCNKEEIAEVLDKLSSLINIKDKNQKLLFIINIICALIPDIPHPIDVLYGDQGTAKTTTSALKKELIDPSELKNLRCNNYNEFVQQASHHWHIPLDNLTSLQSWFSDALCRVVTGEGFSKRELFTNDDDVIYNFRRCITVNGINLVPSKPDILDRSLIFELEPISKSDRIEEAKFWANFNEVKPRVLGAIFSVLSKAMKIYPTIQLDCKPRMADFAIWGAAVAEAMGYSSIEFIDAYNENIELQNAEALEANPIAKVIINFMESQSEWTGSPTDLFHELSDVAESLMIDTKDRRYPNDPRWLWRRIKEVKPNLEAIGITIEKDDTNHSKGRQITIRNSAFDMDDSTEEGEYDVHNDRNDRNNGQQDDTDIILDKLLENDELFSDLNENTGNGHSDTCDCEICIP